MSALRALVADDDRGTALALAATLRRWKIDVVVAHDGTAAHEILSAPDGPPLAILDWMMPGLDGPDICRRLRADPARSHVYLLLLTARGERRDVIDGMNAGADDYVVKPFDLEELRARMNAGVRVVTLQQQLAERVLALEAALSQVKQLHGLLPICSYCKRVRTDQNYWEQVDHYVMQHSDVQFSHGICPPCADKLFADLDRQDTDRR